MLKKITLTAVDYTDKAILINALENLAHDHTCLLTGDEYDDVCDCERIRSLIYKIKKGGE